jgi:hypothetical protein
VTASLPSNAFAYTGYPVVPRAKQAVNHPDQQTNPQMIKPRAVGAPVGVEAGFPQLETAQSMPSLSGESTFNPAMGQVLYTANGQPVMVNQPQHKKVTTHQESLIKLHEKPWYQRAGIQSVAWTAGIALSAVGMMQVGRIPAVRNAMTSEKWWVRVPAELAGIFAEIFGQIAISDAVIGALD